MEETKGTPQTRAKNKYNAKAYDSLRIVVKKGNKDIIKAHAESNGESINGFVNRAIDEAMERDKASTPFTSSRIPHIRQNKVAVYLPFICRLFLQ